uniref:Uncharacterized protein n=1 Tax=Orbilia brochopaga TaxID=3140254 RepID=A0A4Y5MV60_9PEZI|nr:hypothetical protein [Drechslerella brochopaga]
MYLKVIVRIELSPLPFQDRHFCSQPRSYSPPFEAYCHPFWEWPLGDNLSRPLQFRIAGPCCRLLSFSFIGGFTLPIATRWIEITFDHPTWKSNTRCVLSKVRGLAFIRYYRSEPNSTYTLV